MKWILRSLMIILLIGALSESRAEDAATIKKQIEDLSAKLVEYQKDKARFIELEVEKKKLETELISASGQQRLDLEAKLKTAEQKLQKARQGYLAIEKTTQEIKVLK